MTQENPSLSCPQGYQEVVIERINTLQATPEECAYECYKQAKCKAFTIISVFSNENKKRTHTCILTGFPESGTKQRLKQFGGIEQSEITCVKQPSK